MPVKGTVIGRNYENRIENLEIGQTAYIRIDNIILTKKGIFIDINSEVVYEAELDEEDKIEYYLITRIGPGFDSEDWELDLTTNNSDHFLLLDGEGLYHDLMKKKKMFIFFSEFEFEDYYSGNEYVIGDKTGKRKITSEIEQLEIELKQAEEIEDYKRAETIAQELEKKRLQQKNKN